MAKNMRDDFSAETKTLLASRVGYKCSNPDCRKTTIGPHEEKNKKISIGVAAHTTAAAENGPRYNPSLTEEERKSYENGIWLCNSCSRLIDSDCLMYTVSLLQTWKSTAEQLTLAEMQTNSPSKIFNNDKKLLMFYSQCFDRPAFTDFIREEGSMENFDKAIEDTNNSLNTGVLRTRDGDTLKSEEGKSYIVNPEWRNKLDVYC